MIIGMSSANKTQQAKTTSRYVWGYRLELGAIIFGATLFWMHAAVPLLLYIGFWLCIAGIAIWQRNQVVERAHEALYGARIRRQVKRAAMDSGFGEIEVEKVILTLPGEWAKVRVPRGSTVDALEKSARSMAGCLRVSDVRVIPDRKDRSRASISIIRRDPFDELGGYAWPLLRAEFASVREDMPIGFDEYGRMVKSRLLSRNLLVGGAPDSGKSSFLRLPAAYAALDPKARLWLMDGKSVEFEAWKTCAHAFVSGPDLKGAVDMLTQLRDEMEARYQRIRAAGEVFVLDDMEVDILMIDEVPTYTRPTVVTDKKAAEHIKNIQGLLWTIVARGRAAGRDLHRRSLWREVLRAGSEVGVHRPPAGP
jgi:hypothetical protein